MIGMFDIVCFFYLISYSQYKLLLNFLNYNILGIYFNQYSKSLSHVKYNSLEIIKYVCHIDILIYTVNYLFNKNNNQRAPR